MKYISPEYWNETDAFIREFDLEITGITKIINNPFNDIENGTVF